MFIATANKDGAYFGNDATVLSPYSQNDRFQARTIVDDLMGPSGIHRCRAGTEAEVPLPSAQPAGKGARISESNGVADADGIDVRRKICGRAQESTRAAKLHGKADARLAEVVDDQRVALTGFHINKAQEVVVARLTAASFVQVGIGQAQAGGTGTRGPLRKGGAHVFARGHAADVNLTRAVVDAGW